MYCEKCVLRVSENRWTDSESCLARIQHPAFLTGATSHLWFTNVTHTQLAHSGPTLQLCNIFQQHNGALLYVLYIESTKKHARAVKVSHSPSVGHIQVPIHCDDLWEGRDISGHDQQRSSTTLLPASVCLCLESSLPLHSSGSVLNPFLSQPAGSAFCHLRKAPLSHVIEILLPEVGGCALGLCLRC